MIPGNIPLCARCSIEVDAFLEGALGEEFAQLKKGVAKLFPQFRRIAEAEAEYTTNMSPPEYFGHLDVLLKNIPDRIGGGRLGIV